MGYLFIFIAYLCSAHTYIRTITFQAVLYLQHESKMSKYCSNKNQNKRLELPEFFAKCNNNNDFPFKLSHTPRSHSESLSKKIVKHETFHVLPVLTQVLLSDQKKIYVYQIIYLHGVTRPKVLSNIFYSLRRCLLLLLCCGAPKEYRLGLIDDKCIQIFFQTYYR